MINEIFYHAPGDIEDLEYIELHNSGAQAVDLGGWAFTKGIKCTFAPEDPSSDQSITVEADVRDANGLSEVNLLYHLGGPGFEKPGCLLSKAITSVSG